MIPPKTLAELLVVSAKVGLDEFLRNFDSHYLVASGVLSGKMKEGRERNETGVLEIGGRPSHTPSQSNPQAGIVYPLTKKKRGGGSDAGRITVGRSNEQDVCIPDASVSHAHAYFEIEGEVVFVIDAGSRNGTYLNLTKLESGARRPVHDEDVITFGRVSYQIFSPGALFIALQSFREGSV